MSSLSDRDEREIDEYYDQTSSSGRSNESSNSGSSSTDKQYSSRVPRVPLEVHQEELRKRATS